MLGDRQGVIEVPEVAFGAGHHRHPGGDHGLARRGLIPHAADDRGVRPDIGNAPALADVRQQRILRQETVAGVQGVTAGGHRQVHDAVGVEVAAQGVGAEIVGLVGLFDVQGVAIGIGVDGGGFQAHFGTGADDADRNFTAIGHQYLVYQ